MLELILAAQIFLVTNVQCGDVFANGCFSTYSRNDERIIQVQESLSEFDKYIVFYHEQGHNLMRQDYAVPSLFRGEEDRASQFSWWMIGKSNNAPFNPENPYDKYFSEICKADCVKAILDIDLSTYPIVDKI